MPQRKITAPSQNEWDGAVSISAELVFLHLLMRVFICYRATHAKKTCCRRQFHVHVTGVLKCRIYTIPVAIIIACIGQTQPDSKKFATTFTRIFRFICFTTIGDFHPAHNGGSRAELTASWLRPIRFVTSFIARPCSLLFSRVFIFPYQNLLPLRRKNKLPHH